MISSNLSIYYWPLNNNTLKCLWFKTIQVIKHKPLKNVLSYSLQGKKGYKETCLIIGLSEHGSRT